MVGVSSNVATASQKKSAMSMMMDTTTKSPANIVQRLLAEAALAQKVKRGVEWTSTITSLAIVLIFVATKTQKKPVTILPRVH